jgi:CHAD domain-containing protein
MDCATAFQLVARDCLAKMKAQRRGTVAGDAEALHQMRVAIARFRAMVAFFAVMTSDAMWPKLAEDLAWLYAMLGDARDADVMAALAQRKRYRKWAARAGVQDAKECDRLHRHVIAGVGSARFRRLMEGLSRWIEHGPWLTRRDGVGPRSRAGPLKPYCRQRLKSRRARLIRKGRHLADMSARQRHRLRLKAKRYRYVLEALNGIFPAGDRAKLRRLHTPAKLLQQALGDLRDLQRLRHIGAASPRRPPGYRKRKRRLLKAAHAALREIERPFPVL